MNQTSESIWETIIRYILGFVMMTYGLIKIFNIQLVLPESVYDLPLKDIDGVTLTWAFLGHSLWFSVMLGLFEFIPGILLLFKKTKLLGAILVLPGILTVFSINNAFGFLPHMRIFTGVLLIMNLTLLLFHYMLFIQISGIILSPSSGKKGIESFVNITLIVIVIFVILVYLK